MSTNLPACVLNTLIKDYPEILSFIGVEEDKPIEIEFNSSRQLIATDFIKGGAWFFLYYNGVFVTSRRFSLTNLNPIKLIRLTLIEIDLTESNGRITVLYLINNILYIHFVDSTKIFDMLFDSGLKV